MNAVATAPVKKEVTVAASMARAFEVFTAGIGSWWPLVGHSVGDDRSESIEMECHVEGRLVERIQGGEEAEWGRVLTWDPPRRVVFSWYPGRMGQTPTEVEVRFEAIDEDRTRVQLEHRGWERVTPERLEVRPSYVEGWGVVLGHYAAVANA